MEVNLPDPGRGRYWSIVEEKISMRNDESDFILVLHEYIGTRLASQKLWVDAPEYEHDDPIQRAVNAAVEEIFNKMRLRDLVREYKFDGEK